jgi:hypothetical protein
MFECAVLDDLGLVETGHARILSRPAGQPFPGLVGSRRRGQRIAASSHKIRRSSSPCHWSIGALAQLGARYPDGKEGRLRCLNVREKLLRAQHHRNDGLLRDHCCFQVSHKSVEPAVIHSAF